MQEAHAIEMAAKQQALQVQQAQAQQQMAQGQQQAAMQQAQQNALMQGNLPANMSGDMLNRNQTPLSAGGDPPAQNAEEQTEASPETA